MGVWTTDEAIAAKTIRQITYHGEAGFNSSKILDEALKIELPLEGVVEYVFSAYVLSVLIQKF